MLCQICRMRDNRTDGGDQSQRAGLDRGVCDACGGPVDAGTTGERLTRWVRQLSRFGLANNSSPILTSLRSFTQRRD